MSECNFITAKFLSLFVEVSSSHSCTEITRILFHIIYRLKNLCFKNRNRNIQLSCVVLNNISVFNTVSRVHYKIYKLKRKFIMPFKFLKKFCHKHRIFAARNTYGYFVIRLYKFILNYSFCKSAPYGLAEFFSYTFFNICRIIVISKFIL